jgi:DNA-binding MarR family transcriptional regulator
VTAVLDRLERAGYLRRVRDAADRRKVMVEITPEVARRSAPVFGPMVEEGMREMSGYTEDEMAVILDFLRRYRAVIQRHTARVQELLSPGAPDGPPR